MTEGQDIVEELRGYANCGLSLTKSSELLRKAADEIERLRKELAAKDLTIARLVDDLTGDD